MSEEILTEELNKDVLSYREKLQLNTPDDELVRAVDKAMKESIDLKDKIDKIGIKNKRYWISGTEKEAQDFHPAKAKITANRIFADVETAIPILTSEPPEPTILGKVDNDTKDRIQKALQLAYEVKYQMQQKLQRMIRNWFIYRVGILKYRWDKKGFVTEVVLPKKVGMDKYATSKDNCEFIWDELEDTLENLEKKFPKQKDFLKQVAGDNPKAKIKYIEFWGGNGEWVCWKLRDRILDKMKNPNWDYDNIDNNIFDTPQFPYIFLNVFNLGDESGFYDDTSLIEQAAPIQEGVSQLERQILDLNEGQKRVWVVSSQAMSETKAQALVNETGDLLVYLDRGAPAGSVGQVQSGKPDASLFNHLSHLLAEIDNIIGMHSTTRGERAQQETLGGRQLLMSSDYGRLDLIVRNVEQVVEEWYNAYLHMVKVYSDIGDTLYDTKTNEEIRLTGEMIPKGIIIMVKKGSTLPTDEVTKRANAIQLAQFGMIDPTTLFEEMSYTNTDKRTQDLYNWLVMTGKIQPPQQPSPATGQAQPTIAGQAQQPDQDSRARQVARINQILQSEQFKQLSPEEQLQITGRAKEILNQM